MDSMSWVETDNVTLNLFHGQHDISRVILNLFQDLEYRNEFVIMRSEI